ncbi:heavy metal-associated isoprenylated plant protein 35-like [Hordeum vulgare subsp. vulgare]|nr:heavy metal-associated isoprenylated plant protein 35-like [Hordeum vulgare subsp. vulgare]
MASGQPAVQTFVLRVSIHCHGCKKKVRKVLKSIQGVHDVKVDAQQHKVLVTGTVDAETLVKTLYKSGKQALPWQHTPAKNPEAPPPAEVSSNDAAAAADKNPAEPVKEPQADDSSDRTPEQEETAPDKTPETEKEAESEKKEDEKEEAKATKPSAEAKKDGGDGEGPAAEPKAKEDTKVAGNDQGEAKEEQSKPKDAAAADRSLSPAPTPAHQEFSPYNAPQPVTSYHTAHPAASVSYYAPQPEQGYSMRQQPSQPQPGYSSLMQPQHPPPAPQQQWSPSYLYMPYPHASLESYYPDYYSPPGTHTPPAPPPPPPQQQWSPSYLYMPYPHASLESYYPDYYSPPGTHTPPAPPPPPPLQDSYRLFDDENPNSCSVM